MAWRQGWIGAEQLDRLALPPNKSGYGDDLLRLLAEKDDAATSLAEVETAREALA